MRYKTRPGLTYHYAHSHKEEKEEEAKPKAPARASETIQANDLTPDYLQGQHQAGADPYWGQSQLNQGWNRIDHLAGFHTHFPQFTNSLHCNL